ncbi:MAG: MFS transporter [Gemmatimonadaceae bacterium]
MAASMFLMALGEELWKRFVPKYLEALGAPITAIGLYGTTRDLFNGLAQYPGGWFADRYGRRRALTLFVAMATLGYAFYLVAPTWTFVFYGLVFVMAWTSMASPTLFAVIGDALPRERRAMAFSVQSILRRIPVIFAPTIGGLLITSFGVIWGVRVGLIATILLACATLLVIGRINVVHVEQQERIGIWGVWQSLPKSFRLLLASDVFIRAAEAMVEVLLVLYAINIIGVSPAQFGLLIAIQTVTAILSYLPGARLADHTGRKPFVMITFVAFTMFPVAVALAPNFGWLVIAYLIAGLREIGEPARKALIVDLAEPHLRARSAGLYQLVRSVWIAPSAAVGALLWRVSPPLPFLFAGVIGLIGTIVFALTVKEEHAG